MARSVFLAVGVTLAVSGAVASCHLSDDPEPPQCGQYQHEEKGFCVENETTELRVTLETTDGGCPAATPTTLTALAGEFFQFENKDEKPHTMRGADGQVWITAPANGFSQFFSIARPGKWAYRVDDCPPSGTVVIE